MQKCKFFMEKLRVTQKALDTYSHAGSLAIDFWGEDGGIDKLYAPCDMIVKRVRLNATGELYVESLFPVLFADGSSDYLHAIFIHGDNRNISTGQIFKQGDYFYSEGGWGRGKPNAFANHVHVEAGKGKFNQLIQFKNPQGTYVIEEQFPLERLFILGGDVEIIDGGGYDWKREGTIAQPPQKLTQEDFLNKIGALATQDEKESGILACLTIAQAILESGWGNSGLTVVSNNLFGIKGEYGGGFVYYPTKEWDGEKYIDITAKFKKYPSWQESLSDHSAMFLRLSRYANLIGEKDYKVACEKVKADGYATAPDYAPKLINLIEQYELTKFNAVIENIIPPPSDVTGLIINELKAENKVLLDENGKLHLDVDNLSSENTVLNKSIEEKNDKISKLKLLLLKSEKSNKQLLLEVEQLKTSGAELSLWQKFNKWLKSIIR